MSANGRRRRRNQDRPPGPGRTAARLAAVQVLYQMAQAGKSAAEALAEFIEFRIGQ